MPAQQQAQPDNDREKQQRQQLDTIIGEQVRHALGQPADLRGVQVRRLWQDHYRVNVLVGADAVSVKVADSYFLVADSDGNIIASTPPLRLPSPNFHLGGRKEPSCANP